MELEKDQEAKKSKVSASKNTKSAAAEASASHRMRVRKRDGTLVPVDVNKIITRVTNCASGLDSVDPMRVATKAISGLYDGATTKELDQLCIQTASLLTFEEPEYSKLSARLLSEYIDEEMATQHIAKFSHSVLAGNKLGLISDQLTSFVSQHARELDRAIDTSRTDFFEYFGLRTLYDRYLLKHPQTRDVIENPQYFFLRVACGLSQTFEEAVHFYDLISKLDYMPSSPTLFNSGTLRQQLSSCYLLDSPTDDLESIYKKYSDVALLSKFAGGIGVSYSRVRSRGSLIKGTNGKSNGIVPWLKTLDSSVAAVNQGGRRKGAACVYLETWHADIYEFLELRENTGDEAQRTYNLNLANWVPDLFMKRVEADEWWSLFDPKKVPTLVDTFGSEFDRVYAEAEEKKLFEKQIKARDLYARMMKTLAETGNGWMTFKDPSNSRCNQTAEKGRVVHLSNLCTEILEVTSDQETAVCNLGSINLARHTKEGAFDFAKLESTVKTAVRYLDRVIDINFYPISTAEKSNNKWRPVGLGLMGLQDLFFQLDLAFDSEEASSLSTKIQEHIYFHALSTSCELAEKMGAHPNFAETRAAQGHLQFDLWGVSPSSDLDWGTLRKRIEKFGLRNSLLIAIAPTATIASIVGVYESIEPQISNLFKRETLSGEFLQVNRHLVSDLKERGLWTDEIRTKIKMYEGSIQQMDEIPEELKKLYRTVWEIPMKALIDLAARRGPYIDQSQSLNLFMESPNIGKLSSMYFYAWKQGIKTTYYLRSRPATRISQVTTAAPSAFTTKSVEDAEAVACSLENPEVCDACQ
jgi:ribonucleoside-diphosphate reductase alpha chain